MPFEDFKVEKVGAGSTAVPPNGIKCQARVLGLRKGGVRRYIKLTIGTKLAFLASIKSEKHNLRILFGTGEDRGKIMIAVDNEQGKFTARRDKSGNYSTTITEVSAAGILSMEFETFKVDELKVQSAPGCPPAIIFSASHDMIVRPETCSLPASK